MKKLNNLDALKSVFDLSDEVLDFMKALTPEKETGKYVLNENVFVNLIEVETKPYSPELLMEKHDEYVDVQYILTGNEKIFYTTETDMEVAKPYDEKKDRTMYKLHPESLTVEYGAGEMVVLFPEEAHAPNVAPDDKPAYEKKAVLKVHKKLIR